MIEQTSSNAAAPARIGASGRTKVHRTIRLGGLILALLFEATATPTARADDFTSTGPGTHTVALEVVWKRPLGPGNSRIAVADGKAVTLFSDGEDDWLVAVDAGTGDQLWRYRIASTYQGHDGSRDGPHASPAIVGGVVYGLGARGQLFAVSLADGSELWSIDTVAEIGAVAPFWGFASTPVVTGRALILQATGTEGSIWAFDRPTGQILWSAAHDRVGYQSPALMTLGTRTQVVAVTNERLLGIAPESGEILWTYPLGDETLDGSSEPIALGESTFLLTPSATERRTTGRLFRLSDATGSLALEEVWRSEALRGTYAVPVSFDGRLYGLRGSFLTCVDAKSGETLWRSREPGGYNLGSAEGHLLITSVGGNVILARFSQGGYEEVTRVKLFERGAYAAPAVVRDMIYLRNHAEVAALRIVPALEFKAVSADESDRRVEMTSVLAEFLHDLAAREDKAGAVDEFLASQESIPIVEQNGRVHFLYRGEARDVAIRGSMTSWGEADAFSRVPGTDLFYRTYELGSGGRWEYLFQIDLDQQVTDPLNPEMAIGEWREVSELAMPGWTDVSFPAAADVPEAPLDGFELESEILGNVRDVMVLLPPGYSHTGQDYPLIIVLNGTQALERGLMARSLLHLMRGSSPQAVAAFVGPPKSESVSYQESGGPDNYRELGGPDTARHGRMLAEELLPELFRRYRIRSGSASVALHGIGSAGLAALHAAGQHRDVFAGVAVQSLRFGPTPMQSSILRRRPVFDEVFSALTAPDVPPLRMYLDWASHDLRDEEQGIDLRRDNRALYDTLERSGHTLSGGEYAGGPGWRSWRARTRDFWEAMLPPDEDPPKDRSTNVEIQLTFDVPIAER